MTQRATLRPGSGQVDGPYIYFVTTNTTYREKLFVSKEQAFLLGRIIRNASRLKHFNLLGYCILPDHVHILARNKNFYPNGGRAYPYTLSHLLHAIKRNFARQQKFSGRLWQPRFNFRIIGDERRFSSTIAYMQYNFQKHGYAEWYGKDPFVFIDWGLMMNTLGE